MDMHPPPAYVQVVQAEAPGAPLELTPSDPAAAEPAPVKVDVRKYVPESAVSVTLIVTVSPPSGGAVVYVPGFEDYGTIFKGPRSVGELRLDGPFIYVKLYGGATSFDIQYVNYRVP